ncbi:unnamed protein product [Lactuca virosa]|uniref:Uncharacterized protein n=1 Tax=Lactuca virosa TaxID=75947 RepID=A0AAU9MAI2_9ASTR|nr:unnamed protein product [Lactuca virosa]
MPSSSNANNSSDILSEVRKPALTKCIDDAYSCIHLNEIKTRLDTSIQNREEKKIRIEASNLIHKYVVDKFIDDEIKAAKQEVKYLEDLHGMIKMINKKCNELSK